MGVKTYHPDYINMQGKWVIMRDVGKGQHEVKKKGIAYLPKLKDQDDEEYRGYLLRVTFYNATWRTIAGMVGMLFRVDPQYKLPPAVEPMAEDITLTGIPLRAFVQQVATEAVWMGRAGVLVDYPQNDLAINGVVQTRAQAESAGLRPCLLNYPTESIINWKTGRVRNKTVLTMVVLEEERRVEEKSSEFQDVCETVYRVLDLDPESSLYRQRLFRVKEGGEDEQIGGDFYPIMNGKALDFIPFYFFGVDDVTPKVDEPPLIDLADTNLAHYRVMADYEHGCHFSGLPTVVVTGYQPLKENETLTVGSANAWVFPQPDAKAFYLEHTGAGMPIVTENLDRKEKHMAVLGARMLEQQEKTNETATTSIIHRSGEASVLASIANVLSLGMRRALDTFCEWAGAKFETEFQMNTDFMPTPMDSATLTALVSAWQSGAISKETLFDNLQRGEVIDSGMDFEDEEGRIQSNPPLSMQTAEVQLDNLKNPPEQQPGRGAA